MVEYVDVENMIGCTTFNGVDNLFYAAFVEANGRFNGDACVVVGADDAGVVFVNGTGVVNGVVYDVIIEALFFDGAVHGFVVDQVATGRIDE